jgi:hypothetical protein
MARLAGIRSGTPLMMERKYAGFLPGVDKGRRAYLFHPARRKALRPAALLAVS